MLRIVSLEWTGVFIALQDGTLAELDGRNFWHSADDVRRAAAACGVPVSDQVIDTKPCDAAGVEIAPGRSAAGTYAHQEPVDLAA